MVMTAREINENEENFMHRRTEILGLKNTEIERKYNMKKATQKVSYLQGICWKLKAIIMIHAVLESTLKNVSRKQFKTTSRLD